MAGRPRYRLRTPSTGREIVIEAEPGRLYTDRETGEELEVVGLVLPLAPSSESQPAVGRREPAFLHLVRPARAARSQRLSHLRAAHGAARVLERLYPLFTCVRTWSPFSPSHAWA